MVTNSHLEFAKAAAKTKDISPYFKKTEPELNVINAECLFARFIIKHILPIMARNMQTNCLKKFFRL